MVGHLAPARQRAGRLLGLSLAMLTRLALLFSIVWLTQLRAPLFAVFGRDVSAHDLILGVGGLVLLAQSVTEIHATIESAAVTAGRAGLRRRRGLALVVFQIALTDIVFSLDSVFTAVGLARPDQILIMAAAIVIAMLAMLWASASVAGLIGRYPGIKTLALASLALIGASLIGQAVGYELPKGYLYCAIAFALAVELLNMRRR